MWLEIVPPQRQQPVILPRAVAGFIASALDVKLSLVHLFWHAFGDLGEHFYCAPEESLDDTFRLHGHEHKLEHASDPSARRTYYDEDVPEFIHVTDTCFVERRLCIFFGK
ncbi:hypothetical protein B0H17DRAFT_1133798 [Mycena rosella]|uniref:Uncharacterized protein n=1 Tax=Mycena rosella TaxID=1033263 RepID=A0AAD7DGR4_MYCRO|nr:hypothetical protein B0H17DRAFT_1133798 [Mycena rosella]